ncbi:DNA-binding transcriptional MocR family regulator [Clostridium moniliforme]|uniref:DNA-binding transcriptional MocR family regulator n=1 Tax=Clostridium moniliforme TaxID=39489 RepID=A0ABS4F104_9CLOT|nr:helix-turn-helix domain-containing protein [Clostridium moniliforme]MBP1889772.1 DNA-binding transcriptional MocR family regulator [Clostridium moniliforme]
MTNYTIIQNKLITSNISNGAYRLATLLLSMCYADKDTCYPSQKYLSEKLNRSVRTIQRYLKEIKEAGLLKIKRRGSISNMYTLISKKVEKSVDEIVKKFKKEANVKKTNYAKKELRFNNFTQRNRSEEEWNDLEYKLLGWQ